MMRKKKGTPILIDQIGDWDHLSSSPVKGIMRHYYVAQAPFRALLVCDNNLRLSDLLGRVVLAQIGYEKGWEGFARVPGEMQSKITIRGIVGGAYKQRLTNVLVVSYRDEDS